ncbi:MAG: nucleotidyl transferase, partial [Gemmatimonadales bacterium]
FYLTDAFQYMIDHGARIKVAEVGGWYDCGKLNTLLETNEILLRQGASRRSDYPGTTINDPVYIEDGVEIRDSVIGPNVSIEQGSRVSGSRLEHVVLGEDSTVEDSELTNSMLGSRVLVRGFKGAITLGSESEIVASNSGPR